MRCTLLRDSPTSLAIPRVDQWVASLGFSSKVLISTRSTISPVIVGGTPERYSSANPGRRSRWKRPRHLHTVCGDVPTSRATAWLVLPSAQASTIRVRKARDCVVQGRRAHRSNVCLSSPLSSTAAVGLPRLAAMTTIIIGYHRLLNRSLGQESSNLRHPSRQARKRSVRTRGSLRGHRITWSDGRSRRRVSPAPGSRAGGAGVQPAARCRCLSMATSQAAAQASIDAITCSRARPALVSW